MQSRSRALLVAACVLLAGCGGAGPSGVTPADPQTPYGDPGTETATGTEALEEPLYRLELRNRHDGAVRVRLELTSVDNETTYYETETELQADALRDYTAHVDDETAFRATVSVAEDSVSVVVGPDEGYVIAVQNHTDIDVHRTRPANTTGDVETATTGGTTTGGQSSPPGLTVLNRGGEAVTVRVTLQSVTDGETFYERETTMAAGSQLYLTSEVADREQYRITAAAENATHTHDVFAGESYVVAVQNASAIDGYHTAD